MCTLPSCFIKECNKVSTTSTYCRKHQRKCIGWFQWWQILKKQTRPEKKAEAKREWRNHKESQGDCAERWLAKERQHMANHRARERNWKAKVPASDKHYWLASFVKHLCFSCQTSNCQLLDSHIIHVLPERAPHYIRMCVLFTSTPNVICYWELKFLGKLVPLNNVLGNHFLQGNSLEPRPVTGRITDS